LPGLVTLGRQPRILLTPDMNDDNSTPQTPHLRLDHFLKLIDQSDTGGQAKLMIQAGEVKVNGEVETRRRRKLVVGDMVEVNGKRYPVDATSVRD
jgi:ribosome-associated protein